MYWYQYLVYIHVLILSTKDHWPIYGGLVERIIVAATYRQHYLYKAARAFLTSIPKFRQCSHCEFPSCLEKMSVTKTFYTSD